MGDYTKLSEGQVQQIFDLYESEEVIEFKALSLGISNSNYAISTSNNKYLLKVSNDKSIDELKEEMDILSFLSEQNYGLSIVPYATKEGELVYEVGKLHGVLFPFVEGIPPGPNDATCFEIGQALAKLHSIHVSSNKFRSCEKLSYPASVIDKYVHDPKCPEDFKSCYEDLIGDRAKLYLKENFHQGICHGDLYYDNTLFDHNHITAVLDFEQSGFGDTIFDLGISISGCCLEKGRISLDLINSYIEGYETLRLLPDNEKEFLHEAIIFGLLSISLWRIKRFKDGNLNPLMADSYKQLIYRAEIFKQTVSEYEK